jgi:hypothetical protein
VGGRGTLVHGGYGRGDRTGSRGRDGQRRQWRVFAMKDSANRVMRNWFAVRVAIGCRYLWPTRTETRST